MVLRFYYTAVLSLVVVTTATIRNDPLQLTEPYKIAQYNETRALFGDAGIVSSSRQCGGTGKLIKHRYEECVTGVPGPCVVSPTATSKAEVIFIPSENSKGVEVKTTIFFNGLATQFVHFLPNTILEAGKKHVLFASGGAIQELRGNFFTGQWEIIRSSDRQVQLCNQADFYVT